MNTYLIDSKKFYGSFGEANDFERDLGAYLREGYVHSSPNKIMLFKPVRMDAGNPIKQWWDDESQCDAWFVKFACGKRKISDFINAMPYELPFVGWMRAMKNKPVMYWRTEQILRRR